MKLQIFITKFNNDTNEKTKCKNFFDILNTKHISNEEEFVLCINPNNKREIELMNKFHFVLEQKYKIEFCDDNRVKLLEIIKNSKKIPLEELNEIVSLGYDHNINKFLSFNEILK